MADKSAMCPINRHLRLADSMSNYHYRVFVGGTGGWIGFIAASFAILCIASTFIGMNTVKREGGNKP